MEEDARKSARAVQRRWCSRGSWPVELARAASHDGLRRDVRQIILLFIVFCSGGHWRHCRRCGPGAPGRQRSSCNKRQRLSAAGHTNSAAWQHRRGCSSSCVGACSTQCRGRGGASGAAGASCSRTRGASNGHDFCAARRTGRSRCPPRSFLGGRVLHRSHSCFAESREMVDVASTAARETGQSHSDGPGGVAESFDMRGLGTGRGEGGASFQRRQQRQHKPRAAPGTCQWRRGESVCVYCIWGRQPAWAVSWGQLHRSCQSSPACAVAGSSPHERAMPTRA